MYAPILPPPRNWRDFEELMLDVFQVRFECPTAERHGREGQPQSGVDIYGIPEGKANYWGMQCKQHSQHDAAGHAVTGGKFTKKEVDDEIVNAESFNPGIECLIFATSAARDEKIQEYVRHVDLRRRKSGRFSVSLLWWEDISAIIVRNDKLLNLFYKRFCPVDPADADRSLLSVLQEACCREVFWTPLHMETGVSEFHDAIVHTQTAFATGALRDRQTKVLLRQAPHGFQQVTDLVWRKKLQEAHNHVRDARLAFERGRSLGLIEQGPFILLVRDSSLADAINRSRAAAIMALNDVLTQAGFESIPNPLG